MPTDQAFVATIKAFAFGEKVSANADGRGDISKHFIAVF